MMMIPHQVHYQATKVHHHKWKIHLITADPNRIHQKNQIKWNLPKIIVPIQKADSNQETDIQMIHLMINHLRMHKINCMMKNNSNSRPVNLFQCKMKKPNKKNRVRYLKERSLLRKKLWEVLLRMHLDNKTSTQEVVQHHNNSK